MTDHRPTTDRPVDQTRRWAVRSMVDGRLADRLGYSFYGTVAAVALAGQTDAAVGWLHWPIATAVPAVGALELGGIALAARADLRRRLGEQAIPARLLSGAVATFAVGFNWLGHTNHLAGGFFAGMSALGYCVWLIQAGDRRRDQLRAAGLLPPTSPVYGWWRWLRHPARTARARAIALAEGLDLYASLAAAKKAIRTERRQNAIAKILGRQIRTSSDPTTAQMAVAVFDLDEIAARLADRANYDGLTDLIAVGLDPNHLLRPKDEKDELVSTTTRPTRPNRPATRSTTKPTTDQTPVDYKATIRPAAPAPTDRPRLAVVGRPAAVTNAAHLRRIYGSDLPTVERQIRTRTGWSKERVGKAVEAYRAGADLEASDDSERVLVGASA